MKKPEVSIIILSWNTKALLRQCLKSLSLEPSTQHLTPEIIVVDNGSTDRSPEMVAKEFPQVKLVRNKQNLGFAKGNNQGVAKAGGEVIMFLNSDTIVQNDAIETLFKYLKSKKTAGGVSPLLFNEDGSVQKDPCYLKFPSPQGALFYYNRFLKGIATSLFPRLLFSATDFSQPIEVDQLPGAALMARKELLQEVGGFDEDYQLYFEDTDLSWRLRKKGYQLMVVPQAKIIHLGRKSIEPVIKKRGVARFYFLNFSSLFLFCEKNYSNLKTLLIKIVVFCHLFLTLKFGLIKKLIKR